ncbi:MAG: hypothetical protein E7474_13790 [Ruminococcaceae bacterium]|nr:hypothetical protein [Oscillospiraceae bacterium]
MSASREKKARQERGADYLSPKQQKALEEQKANRRVTTIFTVCAVLFVLFVAGIAVWNSNVIQRSAEAVRVNGKAYTAADMAYYYYSGRSNLLSNATSYGIDTSKSLREQSYSDTQTWYDYLVESALNTLTNTALTAQAAQDAGFSGSDEVESTVKETLSTLESSAANSGYSTTQYLKAIYGPLMTKGVFERNLRLIALAEAYTNSGSDPANYTADELNAAYDADPNAYSTVDYEAIVFGSSSFASDAEETTENTENTESDDGSAAALAAAQDALARYKAGEKLDALADELNGTYMDSSTQYGSGNDMMDWLFDDARKSGDADVVDYTYYGMSMGSMVLVFHSKERADFHTVSVRHILVDDEAKANDILAQFNAGDKSEDSFAALAQANSTDNADDGGLYTGVYPGQMVETFNDWCFDASRQTGDTGIVQTDYGYHVMYFVAHSDFAYWQELVASKLTSDRISAITENAQSELLSGMKYIET